MNKTIELINAGIVKQIEDGKKLPWVREWNQVKIKGEYAKIRKTKKRYSLANGLFLFGGEYATFNEWKKEGFTPLKNSAEYVVFSALYDPETKKCLTIEEERQIKENKELKERVFPVARTYRVFSSFRVENENHENPFIKPTSTEKLEIPASNKEILEIVRKYSQVENCSVDFERQDKAFYNPASHAVVLPMPEDFKSIGGFFGTLFHEIGHSTGKHFGRKGGFFGSPDYAQEELTAELTSAYICAELGIDNRDSLKNNAAYIQNWLQPLKNNLVNFYKATTDAAKAAKYILSIGRGETEEF